MTIKINKITAIIVAILIAVAGFVLYKVVYTGNEEKVKVPDIRFTADKENRTITVESVSERVLWDDLEVFGTCDISMLGKYVVRGDRITNCSGTIDIIHKPTGTSIYTYTFPPIPQLPSSYIPSFMRDISPNDEGAHFSKIGNTREWWYFTVVFDESSGDLAGYVATIGFCHLALGDLKWTFKPDLMVVTLHGPDGKEYGGMINKKRGGLLGLFGTPTLEASSTGVDLKFEDSWAKGNTSEWQVHAEDKDIDKNNEIVIDLDYSAQSQGLWIHSSRLIDKGEGSLADYIFLGCKVTGKVKINNVEYKVKGTGDQEHSWSPGFLKVAIKGWDWCHMTLENGWNIYYSNYYFTKQILPTKTSTITPLASIIITTDSGKTITLLDDVDITIKKSDRIFLLTRMPSEILVKAKPKTLLQPLLNMYKIQLEIDINAENTYEKIWKFPTYVGMKAGLNKATGKISWSDDNGDHKIELNGIGTIWSMRRI